VTTSFRVIDSHTGGEPTRLIIEGGPGVGSGTMAERRQRLQAEHDTYRRALCCEPRGHDVMVGGLLCEPVDPQAAAGVVFFNNVGYLGMCGHGIIGLVETLRRLGRIEPGTHHIETPVGTVAATLHDDRRVSVQNVLSYRDRQAVTVDVPGHGPFTGDVAWGGNWFFLIAEHGQTLTPGNTPQLTRVSQAIMQALADQGITGSDGGRIDHIELFGEPTDATLADSMSFVLCPGGAYDRSPCGTGTSAKVACLAADGKLGPGDVWRQQSVVGWVFEASYRDASSGGGVIPTITGRAHVNGDLTVIVDPHDPFAWGMGKDDA